MTSPLRRSVGELIVKRWIVPCALLGAAILAGCNTLEITIDTRPSAVAPVAAPAAQRSTAEQAAEVVAEPTARPTPTPTSMLRPTAAPTAAPTAKLPVAQATAVPSPRAAVPPDRIVVPALGMDARVIETGWVMNTKKGTTEWQTADYAAGFHRDSALPGWPGNTVISGHHNINGKVFAGLWNLKPGDAITLYSQAVPFRYQVEDVFIVPERDAPEAQRLQNAKWIERTRDERLTLVTCWPPNDNTHRVIVVARPVYAQQQASLK